MAKDGDRAAQQKRMERIRQEDSRRRVKRGCGARDQLLDCGRKSSDRIAPVHLVVRDGAGERGRKRPLQGHILMIGLRLVSELRLLLVPASSTYSVVPVRLPPFKLSAQRKEPTCVVRANKSTDKSKQALNQVPSTTVGGSDEEESENEMARCS